MFVPSLLHFVSQGEAGLEPELKIRSDNTRHTRQNNDYLSPDFGGQFIKAKDGQRQVLFSPNFM
jgi:hypothetical protein